MVENYSSLACRWGELWISANMGGVVELKRILLGALQLAMQTHLFRGNSSEIGYRG